MVTRKNNGADPTDTKLEDNLLEADFPLVDAEDFDVLAPLNDGLVEDAVPSDDEQVQAGLVLVNVQQWIHSLALCLDPADDLLVLGADDHQLLPRVGEVEQPAVHHVVFDAVGDVFTLA